MKIVALVGMPGSGKTEVGLIFEEHGFYKERFGQAVLDEVLARGMEVNEANERKIREALRAEYGMDVMARRLVKRIENLPSNTRVLADGLYSWEEYLYLKGAYKNDLYVVAIHASPEVRYARLTSGQRKYDPVKDKKAVYRSFTLEEAKSRDYSQIENLHQGGPIAMADYHIVNEGTRDELVKRVEALIREIKG
jgi:dephospho-CoA kinase